MTRTEHRCGVRGFNPLYDICHGCKGHGLRDWKSYHSDQVFSPEEYRRVSETSDYDIAVVLRMLDAIVTRLDRPNYSDQMIFDTLFDIRDLLKHVEGDE